MKVRDSLFRLLSRGAWSNEAEAAKARDAYNKNFLKAMFLDRFASFKNGTAGPWTNASELADHNAEWQRSVLVEGSVCGYEVPRRIDRIICCPEDIRPCAKCKDFEDRICGECEIPLCHQCSYGICHEPQILEMGLCNDNLWGYSCELIYKYKVRWLEAAIVTPCWTSFLVYYVEDDGGHLLNEHVQDPKFRTRVRGQAVSYPMPWEDIVTDLRQQFLDKHFMDLPRRQDCLKYLLRVHLSVAGQDMEKHIKQLHVRPFVLLLLLEFLIERKHAVFDGKGCAAALKMRMQEIVAAEYPDQESHLPQRA